MTEKWKQVLEPPSGGLSRLIDAVQSANERRRPRYALAVAAAAIVVAGVFIERARLPERKMRDALTSALGARDRVLVEHGAALELPTSRPDVRMFVIAQMPASDSSN